MDKYLCIHKLVVVRNMEFLEYAVILKVYKYDNIENQYMSGD